MNQAKCNLDLYTEFLISTQKQYSCVELQNVSPDETMAHDSVNRFLNDEKFSPEMLWEIVKKDINPSNGYLCIDDTLLKKLYSSKIELVKWQWSGKDHAVKPGIGIVTVQWVDLENTSLPVDFRIYQKDVDDKTKNDHFVEIINSAFDRGLKPIYVLMDSWYTAVKNLKAVQEKNWRFIGDIQSNRNVSPADTKGTWIKVSELEFADKEVKKVWLKNFGPVLVCKRILKNGDIRYLITNDLELTNFDNLVSHSKNRWSIETMHRGLKQVCGLERSYMRKATAQINHIFCSFVAFIKLELRRFKNNISWYQQKWDIVRDSVRNRLAMSTA